MRYVGNYELQSLNTAQQSFCHKAIVEMWDAGDNGMSYVLKSYGTVVARVTPITSTGTYPAIYDVAVNTDVLSATTLRHVKEFLAQTDDVFRGITLPWLRKEIKDGRPINGGRKVYILKEL